MKEIEDKTCVRFREAQDSNHLLIHKATSPASAIGYQGKIQDFFLPEDSLDRKIVLHELMHTLGFVHEHSR